MHQIIVLVAISAADANRATALPDAETVRRTANEVLSRPHFRLDPVPDLASAWSNEVLKYLKMILKPVLELLRALHEISPVLAWLLTIFLVVALALLVGHIVRAVMTVFQRDRQERALLTRAAPTKVDPAELVRQAFDAESRGDYILGVRLLYRACLTRLERAEGRAFRAGATNREHLNRYRATPLHHWLARFVSVIDSKWYGFEPCLAADFSQCREAYEQVSILATRGENAQRA